MEVPLNCIICNDNLDYKPVIGSDDQLSLTKKLSELKLGLELFLKFLKVGTEEDVGKTFIFLLSGTEDDGLFNCAGGPPCCEGCWGVLMEMWTLQQTIEEMQASRRSYLEKLRESLVSSVPLDYQEDPLKTVEDTDVWVQIRDQLLACVLKPSQSLPLHSESKRRRTREMPTVTTPSTNTLIVTHRALRRKGGQVVHNTPTEILSQNINSRPCHVVLERLPLNEISRVSAKPVNHWEGNLKVTNSENCVTTIPTGRCERKSKLKAYDFLNKRLKSTRPSLSSSINATLNRGNGTTVPSPPASQTSDDEDDDDYPWESELSKLDSESDYEKEATTVPRKRSKSNTLPNKSTKTITSPFPLSHSKYIGNKDIEHVFMKSLQVEEATTKSPISRGRGYTNDKFYMINENTLLCKFSLIRVSNGFTKFSCLESECGTNLEDHDWFALFTKMKAHVESNHGNRNNETQTTCPLCLEQITGGPALRAHLLATKQGHAREHVACEQCWKPIRNQSENYKMHKWTHKSKQEKEESEEGPPRQLVYKKLKGKKFRNKLLEEGKQDVIANFFNSSSNKPNPHKTRTKRKRKADTRLVMKSTQLLVAPYDEHDYDDIDDDEFNPLEPELLKEEDPDYIPTGVATAVTALQKQTTSSIKKNKTNANYSSPYSRSYQGKDINDILVKSLQVEEATTKSPISRGRGYINDKFYMINENTLLCKFSLIRVSNGFTKFSCLESECGTNLEDHDWFALFNKMKAHVESNHGIRNNESQTTCPICLEQITGGPALRTHMLSTKRGHSLEDVACEQCWKPIRHRSENYKMHKWTHKSKQEKEESEEGPPRQIVYKKLKGKKFRNKLLEEGKQDVIAAFLKNSSKETKVKSKVGVGSVTSKEHFTQIRDDLLLYKYTTVKFSYGAWLSCQEPGCTFQPIEGTDLLAFKALKNHVKSSHVLGNESNYSKVCRTCPLCDMGDFRNGLSFRVHLLRYHNHNSRVFICPMIICTTCWKPVKTETTLLNHLATHKNAEEKAPGDTLPYWRKRYQNLSTSNNMHTCEYPNCGKVFKADILLRRHEISHLPKDQRQQYKCPQCPRTFLHSVAVRGHVERIHRKELMRFRHCPICNKKYNWRSGEIYRTHVRSHTNERPFVCDLCGKAFLCAGQFKRHKEKVHLQQGRIFQCEYCEMNYKHSGSLKRHAESAHPDKVERAPEEERLKTTLYEYRPDFIGPRIAFPCQFCEKVFQLKSRMKKHLRNCKLVNS